MKLSEEVKHKMAKLVDKDFVIELLNKKLSKFYDDFVEIKDLQLDPYKRHLGVTSAVFVVEYKIKYLSNDKKTKEIDVFVSAHSDGSRRGAYKKTKALYDHGFDRGQFRVTKPLFFLPAQKAFFYVSSPGRSFFNFFTQDTSANFKPAMKLITAWVKKLHDLEIDKIDFDWPTFHIVDMVPAPKKFIKDFKNDNPKLGKIVEELVISMDQMEKQARKSMPKQLVYGDYHPENVIMASLKAREIEMIDFTDIAIGDPMMDIGTFIQQFDFMGHNFVSRKKINDYKNYFVESYFDKKFKDIDIEYINRINLYQAWTALRSAIFLFYMKDVENPVDDLLKDSLNYLTAAHKNQPKINLH